MAYTVWRAFDLAKNGECQSVHEIEAQLNREGYIGAQEHLFGKTIRQQLGQLICKKQAALELGTAITLRHIPFEVSSTVVDQIHLGYGPEAVVVKTV